MRFAQRADVLEDFRRDVAASVARIAADLDDAPAAAASLFDAWNAALEHGLATLVPGFQPWTLASREPRILARAAALPDMVRLVQRAFGIDDAAAPPATFDYRGRLRAFLHRLFRLEVETVRESEALTGPDAVVRAFEWMAHEEQPSGTVMQRGTALWVEMEGDGEHPGVIAAADYWHSSAHDADMFRGRVNGSYGANHIHRRGLYPEFTATAKKKNDTHTVVQFQALAASLRESRRKKLQSNLYAIVRDFKEDWDAEHFVLVDGKENASSDLLEENIYRDIIAVENNDDERPIGNTPDKAEDDEFSLPKTVAERFEALDAYAQANPGKPVSGYVRKLFPELEQLEELEAAPALPTEAPRTWDKAKAEAKAAGERWTTTPPDFIRETYGPWLGKGFTRKHLGQLDPKLYRALYNWLGNPANEMPADLDLPTIGEENTRMIEELTSKMPGANPREVVGDFTLREAERLRAAILRRQKE